ncbi:MAG: hypothetical protein CMP11_07595 [Zetaproteobacteria bacterium]|nr:hypothetical protein [Pseudobdellovibrionaceae bacterium]
MNQLDKKTKEFLDKVNKLIFIKKYKEAFKILSEKLNQATDHHFLIHLRIIELSSKLAVLKDLKQGYDRKLKERLIEPTKGHICIAYIEQQEKFCDHKAIIDKLENIRIKTGDSAPLLYGLANSHQAFGKTDFSKKLYEKSIKIDPSWFPSYFELSQISYKENNNEEGEYYFNIFEKMSPYSLYGNIETHKKIFFEFIKEGLTDYASLAISALGTWWIENQGHFSIEIQVLEWLSKARIEKEKQQYENEELFLNNTQKLIEQLVKSKSIDEKDLYICIKLFLDYQYAYLSEDLVKSLAKENNGNRKTIDKIASLFFTQSDFSTSKNIFNTLREEFSSHHTIRQYWLMFSLAEKNIDVEKFLEKREEIINKAQISQLQLEDIESTKNLINHFDQDPDLLLVLAQSKINNASKEEICNYYEKIITIDPIGYKYLTNYINFHIWKGDVQKAKSALKKTNKLKKLSEDEEIYIKWLKSIYEFKIKNFDNSSFYLNEILEKHPWNIFYLTQYIKSLMLSGKRVNNHVSEKITRLLSKIEASDINFKDVLYCTKICIHEGRFDIAYSIFKVIYILSQNNKEVLINLLSLSYHYNTKKSYNEFMTLINTNFDNPLIYYSLGKIATNLGKNEIAIHWIKIGIERIRSDQNLKHEFYIELADLYLWNNIKIQNALSFIEFSQFTSPKLKDKKSLLTAHAYLKLGQNDEARKELDNISDNRKEHEFYYLKGLYLLSCGEYNKAKKTWEDLLRGEKYTYRQYQICKQIEVHLDKIKISK